MAQLDASRYHAWLREYTRQNPGLSREQIKAAWKAHKMSLNGGGSPRAGTDPQLVETPADAPPADHHPEGQAGPPPPEPDDDEVYYRQVLQASGEEPADDGKPTGRLQLEPLAFAFEAIFALLAGFFGPWWALAPKEATRIARAWRAWVKSLPKRQAQFLLRLERDVIPTLTLASTIMGAVIPRWEMTVRARRGELPGQAPPAGRQGAPPAASEGAREAASGPAPGSAVMNGQGPRKVTGVIPPGIPGRDPFAQELAEEAEHGEAA